MAEYDLMLQSVRMHTQKKNTLFFVGVFRDDNPEEREIYVRLDDMELEVDLVVKEGLEIRRKYLAYQCNVSQEIWGEVHLPNEWEKAHLLVIENGTQENRTVVFKLKGNEVREFSERLAGNLDYVRKEENEISLGGWVAAGKEAVFQVWREDEELPIRVVRRYRRDAMALFPEMDKDMELGFEIYFQDNSYHDFIFKVKSQGGELKESIDLMKLKRHQRENLPQKNILVKGIRYYKQNGFIETCKKIVFKILRRKLGTEQEKDNYELFCEKYRLTEKELNQQREHEFPYQPTFSIVIPLYNTPRVFLKELIDSVMGQTYSKWQLCLADGSETRNLEDYVQECSGGDQRVCYRFLGYNKGISENTNGALEMVRGDFVAFSDHDDLLTLNALYECVKALNKDKKIDCLYSDEDKMDMDGKTLFMPHFKPDFNIDLLCSHNYITHLFVVRKDIVDKVGGLRSKYDGSQDHDMIFRCVEQARRVYHIPKVLYHWRCHKNSTAMNPESKMYCYESGRKAVEDHFERIGIPATVEMASNYGYFVTHYHWAMKPLVSIIIPNKDHVEDLKKCIESIENKSSYRNYEIIVVENNSSGTEIFDYYKELEKQDHIRVVHYSGEFNYSKINNVGVREAKGEYLLFLNNDTELIEADSIKEMLDLCLREDVGVVGARLYYEDNTIQHAGVILGVGGIANHAFCGKDRGEVGYFFRSVCVQDLSAVTAACMMTKRRVYEEVGGFAEEFAVAFNDVDYCLKVGETGKMVVFTPFSEWYHYESKSRGYENTPEKKERLEQETEIFLSRWREIIENGDPFYNPNFSHERADFSLNMSGN